MGQRIYGLCLGYEDLNDHDQLRTDPMLAVAVNKADPWRWCMNRNWPATNPTHRSITYQEHTTMAYRARPSG